MFPADIEEVKSVIITRKDAIKMASCEIDRYQREKRKNQAIAIILSGLLESWKYPDPGKNQDAFFFLDAILNERVVAREFLTDNTKVYQDRREWDKYVQIKSWHEHYNGVPPMYRIVSISAVGKSECSKCFAAQPVVEHYTQTYDSAEGDEWLREKFVLCVDCNLTTIVRSETSDLRLY